jgi:uncharacterized membrane protein
MPVGRGPGHWLAVLGVFAGAFVHSVLPRGAFGNHDLAFRAAITGLATAATSLLILVLSRRWRRPA